MRPNVDRIEIMNNDGMLFIGISREVEMCGNSKDGTDVGKETKKEDRERSHCYGAN